MVSPHNASAKTADALVPQLRSIVGAPHVLVGERRTRRYRKGYRYGDGEVLAVVRPGSLVEQWRVLNACVEAGTIVISQAANTGLTGGSTPDGDGYDRPIVILNLMRIRGIQDLDGGRQVVCLPGATLDALERHLAPLGREPHSVIGSSCIGASVTGGVCNNSGGSLVRRGPAYTQMALFAQVGEDGRLRLVNHLGIELGTDAEQVLSRLERGEYRSTDVLGAGNQWASDHEYHQHVRDIDAPTPARYNADPRRLYEASGSAGRLAVFALRLDTFATDTDTAVFYIGTNDPAELERVRRDILGGFKSLPISGEYLHRNAYDMAQRYGKDLYLFIRTFGTRNVPKAFAAKSWVDGLTEAVGLGGRISDRLLQGLVGLFPEHLPRRMNAYRDRYAHHLVLKTSGEGNAEAREYLEGLFPSASGDFFECDAREAKAALLNRFVVGGGVVRYRAAHAGTVEDIVALDVALPRNATDWAETLPEAIERRIEAKIYCGHFLCHVLHQEYLVRRGENCEAIEHEILALLDERRAEYPAEHNVGHRYVAKKELADFYRSLDPTNSFNPGIGKTSKLLGWTPARETEPLPS